jgi:hypothetical protein
LGETPSVSHSPDILTGIEKLRVVDRCESLSFPFAVRFVLQGRWNRGNGVPNEIVQWTCQPKSFHVLDVNLDEPRPEGFNVTHRMCDSRYGFYESLLPPRNKICMTRLILAVTIIISDGNETRARSAAAFQHPRVIVLTAGHYLLWRWAFSGPSRSRCRSRTVGKN